MTPHLARIKLQFPDQSSAHSKQQREKKRKKKEEHDKTKFRKSRASTTIDKEGGKELEALTLYAQRFKKKKRSESDEIVKYLKTIPTLICTIHSGRKTSAKVGGNLGEKRNRLFGPFLPSSKNRKVATEEFL